MKLFEKNEYHYTPTYKLVEDKLKIKAIYNGERVKGTIVPDEKGLKELNLSVLKAASHSPNKIVALDSNFAAEMKWVNSIRLQEREEERKKNLELQREKAAEKEGTLVECNCCLSDCAFENMIQCTEGHLFCKSCLAT